MKSENIHMAKLDQALRVLQSIAKHREEKPTTKSDELFYELLLKYWQRVRDAKDAGKYIVSYVDFFPTQIFEAMDMVPMMQAWASGSITKCLGCEQETLGAAKELDLLLEVCSGWRNTVGLFMKGWVPRPDVIIGVPGTCDHMAKAWQILADLYDVPSFFVDHPHPSTEKVVPYLTGELEDLVQYLEEKSHHKMDWDKLEEAVELTRQMNKLDVEIRGLLKVKPSPMESRRSSQGYWINWIYAGMPEGVNYLETLRDELKERVEKKVGAIPNERLRLLTLPPVPMVRMKVLDWMAREYGAAVIIGIHWLWEEVEINPSKPLESLARWLINVPLPKLLTNPGETNGGLITEMVKAAIEYQADGCIIWNNPSCRPVSGFIKMLRNRLTEKVGIPLLVLDNDLVDLTYATQDELQDKLEEFFEILEARR